MNHFRILVVLFYVPFIVHCQNDTIEIKQLMTFSKGKFDVVEKYIISGDLTYTENYVPTETFFYFQDKPFTGVAKTVDSRQITFITFKNGVINGRWYDQTIWNGNLTFEGYYENGRKCGIWKTSHDKKMTRLENFRNDQLYGISINYQDYSDSEFDFKKNDDTTIKTKFSYLFNDSVLKVNGFHVEEFKDDVLISETCYIGKEKANGELKYFSVYYKDTFTISVKYFTNGKFTGERSFCHESGKIAKECRLLDNGLVENIEYDCYSGKQRSRNIYKPKTIFASSLTYFSDQDYELQK
ncbi:MAG: hypothetical protein ACOVQG_11350 [Crocinitomicaceae bacterium]|jgi:antitoxin component YwqK of YwqJK toxin-antitoxin module